MPSCGECEDLAHHLHSLTSDIILRMISRSSALLGVVLVAAAAQLAGAADVARELTRVGPATSGA